MKKASKPHESAIIAISAVRASRVAMQRDLAARKAFRRTIAEGHDVEAQLR
jgi:hypothetical protein